MINRWIIQTMAVLSVSVLCSCVPTGSYIYEPTNESANKLSHADATQILETYAAQCRNCLACSNNVHLKVKDDRIDFIVLDPPKTSHIWFSESPTIQMSYRGQFDVDFTNVRVKTLTNSRNQGWRLSCAGGRNNVWQDEQPKKFADALMQVKLEYDRTSVADEEKFQKSVMSYRAASPKPVLPEEARKFKVQAEDAVHDKQLDEAVDFYGQAIKIAPWWPDGHFNRALVFGELGATNGAIVEMKRYLALVPDASNARAAQDKIYDWERKTGKPN